MNVQDFDRNEKELRIKMKEKLIEIKKSNLLFVYWIILSALEICCWPQTHCSNFEEIVLAISFAENQNAFLKSNCAPHQSCLKKKIYLKIGFVWVLINSARKIFLCFQFASLYSSGFVRANSGAFQNRIIRCRQRKIDDCRCCKKKRIHDG